MTWSSFFLSVLYATSALYSPFSLQQWHENMSCKYSILTPHSYQSRMSQPQTQVFSLLMELHYVPGNTWRSVALLSRSEKVTLVLVRADFCPTSVVGFSVQADRQQHQLTRPSVLVEYPSNPVPGGRISDESKRKSREYQLISKACYQHTSLILSEHTTVLFVCMSETPTEMAVMLSKIFILLPGHSSETCSSLADIETVEGERVRERGRERVMAARACIHY